MVIELEGVSFIRDGKGILQQIDWKVDKGEHWVVFGRNGAGKTALLNLINAYAFPTKGRMNVLGKEFGKTYLGEELRKQIGYVSSSLQAKFHGEDNAFEVVLSGAFASIGLYETPTDFMRKKAVGLLETLGCLAYANRCYENLSQGEKQRVLIARALMSDPGLLILDEPTNGLDFLAREEFLESIEQISMLASAPTIIYVTHHAEEILPVFKKILLLREGTVFATGKTGDVVCSEIISDFFGVPVEVSWQNGRPMLRREAVMAMSHGGFRLDTIKRGEGDWV